MKARSRVRFPRRPMKVMSTRKSRRKLRLWQPFVGPRMPQRQDSVDDYEMTMSKLVKGESSSYVDPSDHLLAQKGATRERKMQPVCGGYAHD